MKSTNPSTVKQGVQLICVRAFRYSGADYSVGVTFPYEIIGVPWKRVSAMILQKKLVPINTPRLNDYIVKLGGTLRPEIAPLPEGFKKPEPEKKAAPKQKVVEPEPVEVKDPPKEEPKKKVVRKRGKK